MRPVVSIRSVIILHMLFDIIINKMDGIELFYLVSLLYLIKTTLGGSPPLSSLRVRLSVRQKFTRLRFPSLYYIFINKNKC